MNLTQIKNATEGDELKDDEVRGLQLRVRGGNKAFFLYYRNATGQRRRPKIGNWPGITLQAAREIAREWLGEVARGKDPSAERATLRASETVASLCDRYLAETKGRASYPQDKGRVKNYLKPEWGARKVAEITKADVLAFQRKMRKKPVAFNRLLALIRQLWKFADMPSPTAGVKRNQEIGRDRYLTDEERPRFLAALEETEIQYPHACALIRGLYHTGARLSELSKAKRADYETLTVMDGDREVTFGVLTKRRHKTSAKKGVKTIIFDEAAHEAVMSVDPRHGWLFGFSSSPQAAWNLVRERAELEDFVIHDLRHSIASDALGEGAELGAIGVLLGHSSTQTTLRYAHLSNTKKLAVLAKVAQARKPSPSRV